MSAFELPGIWMSRSLPLAYRVLPKCACSSVGQILHYVDHGYFYSGNIHDARAPILKWSNDNAEISAIFDEQRTVNFTLGRNPYRRLMSSFADKIFGYQENGRRYGGGMYHRLLGEYGVKWGPRSNLIDNFRGFVRFAADTIERGHPIRSDIHWTPLVSHLRYTKWKNNSWELHFIGQVERFGEDVAAILQLAGAAGESIAPRVPRENTTSLPNIPIDEWYGPAEVEVMKRVYADDFDLLGYSTELGQAKPVRPVDVDALNRALTRSA